MVRYCLSVLTLLVGFSLAGCSSGEPEESAPTPADATHDDRVGPVVNPLAGRKVYEAACASCHDAGIGGAPAIGDQDAWSKRSRLWTAVLSEHAMRGYLQMPEKGGDETLSDAAVAAASEYILSETYPELPSSD
jgi:cytochrome c5